jgi:hypothetical protein
MITNKLKQRSRVQPDSRGKLNLHLQQRPRNKYYRLIKANSLAVLMRLDIFDSFVQLSMGEKSKVKMDHKVKCEPTRDLHFEPTQLVPLETREQLNFGLNKPLKEIETDHLMTPEMQNVVDAMEMHKDVT